MGCLHSDVKVLFHQKLAATDRRDASEGAGVAAENTEYSRVLSGTRLGMTFLIAVQHNSDVTPLTFSSFLWTV